MKKRLCRDYQPSDYAACCKENPEPDKDIVYDMGPQGRFVILFVEWDLFIDKRPLLFFGQGLAFGVFPDILEQSLSLFDQLLFSL